MVRMTAAVVMIVALGIAGVAQTSPKTPAIDLQGKLYRAVFSSGPGVLTAADVEKMPEPFRARLQRFLARRSSFRSSYKSAPDDLKAVRSDAKRRLLERSIVSLVEAPGIEKLAADFVSAAPIAPEWEGMHDGPLAEATFAENVLKKDPSSPLAPWFYIFIAERQRISFESYENEKNEEGMKTSARKYRAFVERARAADDPIYPALIADMEAQPFLYIKNTSHPRDFDPDT